MKTFKRLSGIRVLLTMESPLISGKLTQIGNKFRLFNATYAVFLCECQKVCVKRFNSVRGGQCSSCGCQWHLPERAATHGMSKSTTYISWKSMKARCLGITSTGYEHYGGRGIKICDRWLNDFSAFVKDMGERPSREYELERIDNNGNYEPSNCRWATVAEQNRNRSTSVFVTAFGETMTLRQWERDPRCAIGRHGLASRIAKGVTPEIAITTPSSTIRRSSNVSLSVG